MYKLKTVIINYYYSAFWIYMHRLSENKDLNEICIPSLVGYFFFIVFGPNLY